MIGDMFNLLFRSGIPYDSERNEFKVRPEDMPRIEAQRQIMEEEERWMSSSRFNNKFMEDC